MLKIYLSSLPTFLFLGRADGVQEDSKVSFGLQFFIKVKGSRMETMVRTEFRKFSQRRIYEEGLNNYTGVVNRRVEVEVFTVVSFRLFT